MEQTLKHASKVQRTLGNWRWWVTLPLVLLLAILCVPLWVVRGSAFVSQVIFDAAEPVFERLLHPLLKRIRRFVEQEGDV